MKSLIARLGSLLCPIRLAFTKNSNSRCKEFSVHRRPTGCDLNIHSIKTVRALFLKHVPLRYKPLVALLRTAMRHRVMIVADGDDWQRTHDAITPEFQAGVVATQYAPVIRAVADEAFAKLQDRASGCVRSTMAFEVEVEPLMRSVTSSVLGYILFGHPLPLEEADYLERTLSIATKVVESGIPAGINTGMAAMLSVLNLPEHQPVVFPKAQRQALDDVLGWIGHKIDQAQLAGLRPPLLEGLKNRFADRQQAELKRCIAAEYAMLFIAGIETTASALTFAIAEIANNPVVHDRVIKEARQESNNAPGSQTSGAQFPYLHCVFRETLRRHTVVPTMLRETETDYELAGEKPGAESDVNVRVRKGATLRYLPIQGHMKRSIWTNPRLFDPDRFAKPLSSEQTINYIPFGFGPQRCPGHAMATTEGILILLAFFRRFDLETKEIVHSIPVERNAVFTNRPVGVTARVHAAAKFGCPHTDGELGGTDSVTIS
jgi:cytochrome P450 family 6